MPITKSNHPNKILLMIPGPSEPEPEVLASLALPVMAHYGSAWARVYDNTLAKLQKIFKTKNNEVILLPSPGQTAVEMAVASLVKKGQEAFVCANGFFSDMIVEILKFYGAKPYLIKAQLGEPVTGEHVKAAVEGTKKAEDRRLLFLVHNETSTGLTNPAKEIMKVAQAHDLVSVLDSISAFGGIDVRVDEWKVDYCIGYPSKAVGGVFGVTPVCISKECWQLAKKLQNRGSHFLNLNVWKHFIDEWAPIGHPHPSTMPTNTVLALNTAMDRIFEEGLDMRYLRHEKMARKLEKGLEEMGLSIFPDKKFASSTVTAAAVNPKLDQKLRSELLQKYGIMISGGLGNLSGKVIRIGHMGTSATPKAISITLSAMSEILKKQKEKSASS